VRRADSHWPSSAEAGEGVGAGAGPRAKRRRETKNIGIEFLSGECAGPRRYPTGRGMSPPLDPP